MIKISSSDSIFADIGVLYLLRLPPESKRWCAIFVPPGGITDTALEGACLTNEVNFIQAQKSTLTFLPSHHQHYP